MDTRLALVAYATETGNALDYAEELVRILERLLFTTCLASLDALDPRILPRYTLVILVVSTTGQGDIPTNGRQFWRKLLLRKLPPTCLKDLQFSTFGLGDSSYPKFNWAARKLHKRFIQLGAHEFHPRGEADEQHEEGLDASFVPWAVDFRNHLLHDYLLPQGVTPIPENQFLQPSWQLGLCQGQPNGDTNGLSNGSQQFQNSPGHSNENHRATTAAPVALNVKLERNNRMTPSSHWQDVRHLEFTSESKTNYSPGDILTIYPKNTQEDVEQVLTQMNWIDVADRPIHFVQTGANSTSHSNSEAANGFTNQYDLPILTAPPVTLKDSHTTLRNLLTEQLDITAIPRRSFFSAIANFTDNQFHQDRLVEFTKPEYLDELYDYTTRPRRSILEVLQEFDSVKVPWQFAAYVFPPLRGRQFSIASGGSLKKSPNGTTRFELLVAIVKYKTVIKKIREGVCTRYLANLPEGLHLNVTLQKGGLAVSKDEARRPVIMIGPGTGVAPMRSLIWERKLWLQDFNMLTPAVSFETTNDASLFFGCRNEAADYFFRDEWQDLQGQMPLTVHPAFSRDQRHKVYVQDLIRKQSDSVYKMLYEANGLIYVCGSSGKMPQAVRAALVKVFEESGQMSHDVANEYLERIEEQGRYKQETW
ncbi:NAPDH-dependent diflavin reductase [Lecanora helva]